jgi:hypothetical protein
MCPRGGAPPTYKERKKDRKKQRKEEVIQGSLYGYRKALGVAT